MMLNLISSHSLNKSTIDLEKMIKLKIDCFAINIVIKTINPLGDFLKKKFEAKIIDRYPSQRSYY